MKSLSAIVLCAALLTTGCADLGALGEPDPRSARIDEAKARRTRWMRERPLQYEIRYLLIEGGAGSAESYRLVKIRNSSVLDTTCPNAKCPVAHLKHVRQVHEIYDLIIEDDPDCDVKATYRNDTNVPSAVTRTCKPGTKPDFSLAVTAFLVSQ
jgi:hypothetical protein